MATTLSYGPSPSQAGELHLPGSTPAPVVCLFHGGFWRHPYGRDQMDAVARDLAGRGYAVWNAGYRRVGEPGGGWPGTLEDAFAAVDALAAFPQAAGVLDLARVALVGHSAGGHLALLAGQRNRPAGLTPASVVRPKAVAALAPVADLQEAHRLDSGRGAVAALLGGSPDQVPERYAAASPRARLPLGIPQLLLHGDLDAALPLALSRDYAEADRAAGDAITFHALAGQGHMAFLDPAGEAHGILCAWLAEQLGPLPRT